MGDKKAEVEAGRTPCERCGSPSITTGAKGEALCGKCNQLVKSGAVPEPTIRQAPEHLADRLTK